MKVTALGVENRRLDLVQDLHRLVLELNVADNFRVGVHKVRGQRGIVRCVAGRQALD